MHQTSGKYRPVRAKANTSKLQALAKARIAKAQKKAAETSAGETEATPTQSPKKSPSPKGRTGKKFSHFKNLRQSTDGSDSEYCIISLQSLESLVSQLACNDCKTNNLSCYLSERKGFAVKVCVKCKTCDDTVAENYSSVRIKNHQSTRPPFDINRKLVSAFLSVGVGHNAMLRFGQELGMKVMDISSWTDHFKKLSAEAKELLKKILDESRAAVRRAHEALDPSLVGKRIICIAVSVDGSWHRRGHASLYGVVLIIDILTGLVVDIEILSKYCHLCAITKIELGENTPEFQVWHEGHVKSGECSINFEGASGNMEAYGMLACWKRSEEEAGMQYTSVLGDGDGKSHSLLLKEDPPIYGPDVKIEREECTNHVSKRLGTALRNLKQKTPGLGGRAAGALTDQVITSLQGFFHKALTKNIPDIKKMQQAIKATVLHCGSTDKKPNHSLCPKTPDDTNWCFYNKRKYKREKDLGTHEKMPVKLDEKVVKAILPVYERLSSEELMKRCARGGTSNANEGIHSVIWKKVPKHVFVSLDRLMLGVIHAVGEWNFGAEGFLNIQSQVTGHLPSESSQVIQNIFLLFLPYLFSSRIP